MAQRGKSTQLGSDVPLVGGGLVAPPGGIGEEGAWAPEEQVQALRAELEQVSFELRWIHCEHRALEEHQAQARLMHQTVLGQRTQLAQQVASLQAEVERLQEACALQEQRCLQAEAEIRELSRALLSAAGVPQRAMAQAAALEAQIEQWKQAYTALDAECERLRAALAGGRGLAG